MPALPTGAIIEWWGSIATIPTGFVLCDGANGTPDLRDRFVVGAGGLLPVDDTGGALTHDHDFTSVGHDHDFPGGTGIEAGIGWEATTTSEQVPGTTDEKSNLPPYHALAYIMKT